MANVDPLYPPAVDQSERRHLLYKTPVASAPACSIETKSRKSKFSASAANPSAKLITSSSKLDQTMAASNLKIVWMVALVMALAAVAGGLPRHKSSVSLSNVRNFDEQIRLAYKPELEEPYRPGRFLVDNASDDDFIREDRTIKFPKLERSAVF